MVKEDNIVNEIRLIGCCGAYCKTCPPLIENYCKGCKLGYDTSKRDINNAKCKMKVCCFKERKFETCADCPDYSTCKIIHGFYDKRGYKYKKYKQSIEFIRKNGIQILNRLMNDGWNGKWYGPYGSGTEVTKSHKWVIGKTFVIHAKAKDSYDVESD